MFGKSRESREKDEVIKVLREMLNEERKLNAQLLDRLMSKSFQEYQVLKDRDEEVDLKEPQPIYPTPGTIDTYEAKAYETGR